MGQTCVKMYYSKYGQETPKKDIMGCINDLYKNGTKIISVMIDKKPFKFFIFRDKTHVLVKYYTNDDKHTVGLMSWNYFEKTYIRTMSTYINKDSITSEEQNDYFDEYETMKKYKGVIDVPLVI